MSETAVRLTDLLRPHLRLLAPGTPLQLDDDLGSLGLDSMESIDVLMKMESEFGVPIPDELLTVETLATPRGMLEVLEAQLARAGRA